MPVIAHTHPAMLQLSPDTVTCSARRAIGTACATPTFFFKGIILRDQFVGGLMRDVLWGSHRILCGVGCRLRCGITGAGCVDCLWLCRALCGCSTRGLGKLRTNHKDGENCNYADANAAKQVFPANPGRSSRRIAARNIGSLCAFWSVGHSIRNVVIHDAMLGLIAWYGFVRVTHYCAPHPTRGTGPSRVLGTLCVHRAPPPLGGPWT